MIKKISKVGNSQGIILDAPLMEMAHPKVGDEMHVTLHEGGSITFMPLKPRVSSKDFSEIVEETMSDYAGTMKNLA